MRGPIAAYRRRRLARMLSRAFWRTTDVALRKLRAREDASPWVGLLEDLERPLDGL